MTRQGRPPTRRSPEEQPPPTLPQQALLLGGGKHSKFLIGVGRVDGPSRAIDSFGAGVTLRMSAQPASTLRAYVVSKDSSELVSEGQWIAAAWFAA